MNTHPKDMISHSLSFSVKPCIMTALQTLKKAIMAVNDPTSAINLQLNELIEHIATFALNYKIKYNEDNKLIEQIDEYLDDTFMLFSSYGINMQDLQKWRKSGNRLFRCFVNATKENCEFILLELLQPWVEVCPKTFNENRLFNAFTSLLDTIDTLERVIEKKINTNYQIMNWRYFTQPQITASPN